LSQHRQRRVIPTCTRTMMLVLPRKTWSLVPAFLVYTRLLEILVEANRLPHLIMMETAASEVLAPSTLITSFLCIL
jgi:hypothetical protein